MKLRVYLTFIIMGLNVLSFTLHAGQTPAGPHLVTLGSASIEVMPDIATLTAEVSAFDKDVRVAKKNVDLRVADYLNFLEKNTIERKDIRAANLRTRAEYQDKRSGVSVPIGYRALRYVQVTVRQLDKLNVLLGAALESGLHDIHTLEFAVTDEKACREQVVQKAIADAQQQAQLLTKGFAIALGPVFAIRYLPAMHQQAALGRLYKTADTAVQDSETYEPQAMRFDAQVEVVFELKR